MIDGVSLVIPAYNEAGAVGGVVRAFRSALDATGLVYEILLVDDGSTDATAAMAQEAGAEVVPSPQNLGYGLALRRGILAARFEYIVICDADGTYPAAAIAELTRLAEHLDMVVAARTGPHFRGWGAARAGSHRAAGYRKLRRRTPRARRQLRLSHFSQDRLPALLQHPQSGVQALRPGSLWP